MANTGTGPSIGRYVYRYYKCLFYYDKMHLPYLHENHALGIANKLRFVNDNVFRSMKFLADFDTKRKAKRPIVALISVRNRPRPFNKRWAFK